MANTTFWEGSDHYLCDKELAQAFHIARTLGMPLLIEGEPGTGKRNYHCSMQQVKKQKCLFILRVRKVT